MDNHIETTRKTERLNQLSKQHFAELSKYTYFVLAVTEAAIGYALKSLEGKQPKFSIIFIVLSIILWIISFILA